MDSKIYAKIDAATAAFDMARLHELVALWRALRAAGIAIEMIEDFMEEKTARQVREQEATRKWQATFDRKAMRCPACGLYMLLAGVNTGPRDQVGGAWRSQWFCPDLTCAETVFNIATAAEVLNAMGLGMPVGHTTATGAEKRRRCNGKA